MKQLITALGFLVISTTVFAEQNTINFNIPAQKAATAVIAFGEQADTTVVVDHGARDVEIHGLQGSYSVREAIEQMLMGSGLTYRITDNSIVVSQSTVSGARDNAVDPSGKAGSEGASRQSAHIDEIIVTAEKRAESVQDIPIAISAISGEKLTSTGVLSIKDLQKISPNFQFGHDGGVNYVGMRGISAGLGVIGAEGSVTISRNGVTLGRLSLWDADLYDIERVEILRGPQGVINGRNATGGAVNIHTRVPTDGFEAGIKGTVGNYNRFASEGYISGPILNSGLRGRLAFSTDNADGWLKNDFLNEQLNDKKKAQIRATVVADIFDNLEATLILDAVHDKSNRNGALERGRIRPDTPSLPEFLGVPGTNLDKLTFEADQVHSFNKEQFDATLKLVYDLSSTMTLTSITGYIRQDLDQTYDCDGVRLSYCGFPKTPEFAHGYDFDVTQFSQELTLVADLAERLDLILGSLYLDDDSQHFNHYTASEVGLTDNIIHLDTAADLTSYAIYTQLRYQLTDYLRLTSGIRYTKDKKGYRETGVSDFFMGFYESSNSWGAYTPRFAIDITPTEDLTLYASVSRGFRSGGYSITFLAPEDEFDPEFVWSYEVGLKANLVEGRVYLAANGFFMDYNNVQQIVFGLTGPGSVNVINAAGAEIKGVELELDVAATDKLRFDFSGAWLDAKFSEFNTGDPIFPELGVYNPALDLNTRNLAGKRLPRAPEWKVNVGGEYSIELSPDLMGVLRADYSWQSEVFFEPYNYALAAQESYGLLGFSASLKNVGDGWSMTLYMRNALDKRYFTAGYTSGPGIYPVPTNTGLVGEPRTYGVTLSLDF